MSWESCSWPPCSRKLPSRRPCGWAEGQRPATRSGLPPALLFLHTQQATPRGKHDPLGAGTRIQLWRQLFFGEAFRIASTPPGSLQERSCWVLSICPPPGTRPSRAAAQECRGQTQEEWITLAQREPLAQPYLPPTLHPGSCPGRPWDPPGATRIMPAEVPGMGGGFCSGQGAAERGVGMETGENLGGRELPAPQH